MVVFFGRRELKQFSRLENGQLVYYGYSIDYDKDGNETGRTEPQALGLQTPRQTERTKDKT